MADLWRAQFVQITGAGLVQLYLDRIAAYDKAGPKINSIITVNPKAKEEAAALDRERAEKGARGPLHGIPVIIKDQADVAGMATTLGSVLFKDHYPDRDCVVVEKLKAAAAAGPAVVEPAVTPAEHVPVAAQRAFVDACAVHLDAGGRLVMTVPVPGSETASKLVVKSVAMRELSMVPWGLPKAAMVPFEPTLTPLELLLPTLNTVILLTSGATVTVDGVTSTSQLLNRANNSRRHCC